MTPVAAAVPVEEPQLVGTIHVVIALAMALLCVMCTAVCAVALCCRSPTSGSGFTRPAAEVRGKQFGKMAVIADGASPRSGASLSSWIGAAGNALAVRPAGMQRVGHEVRSIEMADMDCILAMEPRRSSKLRCASILDAVEGAFGAIVAELPDFASGCDWELQFASSQHGTDIATLQARAAGHELSVLLVRDDEGGVFGAFIANAWRPNYPRFYGSGDSFLIEVVNAAQDVAGGAARRVRVHRWTSMNQQFMLTTRGEIAFGGGESGYGILLDDVLDNGTSEPCETYGNDAPLASAARFRCAEVELWGLKLDADRVGSARKRARALSVRVSGLGSPRGLMSPRTTLLGSPRSSLLSPSGYPG